MTSHGRSVLGIVAEQSTTLGMANPGYMEEIAEEGSSIGSSIPGTPLLGEQPQRRQAEQTAGAGQDGHGQTSTVDNSSPSKDVKVAIENPADRLI